MRRMPERGRAPQLHLRLAAQRKARRSSGIEDTALERWRWMTAGVARWTRFNAGVTAGLDGGPGLAVPESVRDQGRMGAGPAKVAASEPPAGKTSTSGRGAVATGKEVTFAHRPRIAERSRADTEAQMDSGALSEGAIDPSRLSARGHRPRTAGGAAETLAREASIAQPSPSNVGAGGPSPEAVRAEPAPHRPGPDVLESAPAWAPLPTVAQAPAGLPLRPGAGGSLPWND